MSNIDEVKNRILAKSPLELLVGDFVKLEKRAGRFLACCPFHEEKTPSFYLYDDHYHCFGCGAHGDAISLVQKLQGLGFIQALRWLANKFSVEIPELERSTADYKLWKKNAQLGNILVRAQEFFVSTLKTAEGSGARAYLVERGFGEECWAEMGFGYAPDAPKDLIKNLQEAGHSLEDLEKVSLASTFDGRSYDFFRHRLTIPIRDIHGRLIAFGGRALGDQQQKYKNSRYDKGRTLFALDSGRKVMRRAMRAIVVEGYMDALKLKRYGFHETVACQGTALTSEHMRLLRSATNTVYLLFDGDRAGFNASLKLLSDSLNFPELQFRVASLPDGQDPDSYVSSQGASAIERLLEEATELLDFGIQERLKSAHGTQVPNLINSEFVPWLSKVSDPIQRSFLLEKVSRATGVEQQIIAAAVAGKALVSSQPGARAPHGSAAAFGSIESEGEGIEVSPPDPLGKLEYEFIGHLFFATPGDELDCPGLDRFISEDLEIDEVWLFFAKEITACLQTGEQPASKDQGAWVSSQSQEVMELIQKYQREHLAFNLKNRKKMLERLMLLDRQNKIKHTITSIKDSMAVVQISGDEEIGERKKLAKHFLDAHRDLRAVQKELMTSRN